MRTFKADYLRSVGVEIFKACGAPAGDSAIVAGELIEASLMGLDSHGVIRYIWYAQEVADGKIVPGGRIRVVKETPTTAVVDCGFNFGPVGAAHMVELVCEKAKRQKVACVASQNCHHVSRLGSYPQQVAERGLFSFATANTSRQGHQVVPWGGKEGRIATNPLAYAAPTSGNPVVFDMSTSMISEGKIRVLMHEGRPVPDGCIQDADGNPITSPDAFYGPPRGTILPFGSEYGYKGFGLSLLVEILSGILVGMDSTVDHKYLNGLCLVAIDPEAFCGLSVFRHLIDVLTDYVTTTPTAPGHSEVVMPGMLDFRTRDRRLVEGIPVADETWAGIANTAKRVGAVLPPASDEREMALISQD